MITLNNATRHETVNSIVEPKSESRLQSRRKPLPERILVAEHRDEVFARLAEDLRKMGHTVFRASRADDVCRVYSYGQIDLVLYNYDLPCESIWLNATKLRMFDAYVRIWLYMPWKAPFERQWANLSRIERVIYYRGDLFYLADQINHDRLCPRPESDCPIARFFPTPKRVNEQAL